MFFLHIFTFKFEMIKHIRLISKEYERWNGGDGNADDKIETDTPPFLRHTRLRVFVEIRCDDRPPQWESLRGVGEGVDSGNRVGGYFQTSYIGMRRSVRRCSKNSDGL